MKYTLISVIIFAFIAVSCHQKEKTASHQHQNGCEQSHSPADSLKPNQESFDVATDSSGHNESQGHCDENHSHNHKH